MKQITEDYCSYEVSKLLKEKGFNVPCRFNYRSKYPNVPKPFYHKSLKDFNGEEYKGLRSEWFSAPTHQMALKYLREVHNIFIEIRYVPNQFTDEPSYKAMIWDMSEETGRTLPDDIEYMFYETCVNAALLYVLKNLI